MGENDLTWEWDTNCYVYKLHLAGEERRGITIFCPRRATVEIRMKKLRPQLLSARLLSL